MFALQTGRSGGLVPAQPTRSDCRCFETNSKRLFAYRQDPMTETHSMAAAQEKARRVADQLADQLEGRNQRIVFAESCTAGLVSATLAQRPGISGWLIGSAVTYRASAKVAWLGVPESTLRQHTAESAQTTAAMARRLLDRTPEADLAVAVTGHLGPGAPPVIDGHV